MNTDKLSEIQDLTWLPWIGKDYFSCSFPLLVLGESHYRHNDFSCMDIESDRNYTRDVLGEYVEHGRDAGNQFKTYEPMESVLRGVCFDSKACRCAIWDKVAYMNIVQRCQNKKDGAKNWREFLSGWKVVLQVTKVLKPRAIVCFSTNKKINRANFNRLHEFSRDLNFTYSITLNRDTSDKIGGTIIAIPGGILFEEDNVHIPVIFLQHASRIKKITDWQDVLRCNCGMAAGH